MTKKLLTGTLSLNTNKQKQLLSRCTHFEDSLSLTLLTQIQSALILSQDNSREIIQTTSSVVKVVIHFANATEKYIEQTTKVKMHQYRTGASCSKRRWLDVIVKN